MKYKVKKTVKPDIVLQDLNGNLLAASDIKQIKQKVQTDADYAPTEEEINMIDTWSHNKDYQEVNQLFDNRFPCVFNELQSTFRI
jgi:hypothetical protein